MTIKVCFRLYKSKIASSVEKIFDQYYRILTLRIFKRQRVNPVRKKLDLQTRLEITHGVHQVNFFFFFLLCLSEQVSIKCDTAGTCMLLYN